MKVILNKQLVDREEAHIDMEDRGYQFGDGIYEGIRVYQRKMFMFEEHMTRLYNSANQIKINIPYTEEEICALLERLILENPVDNGFIYFQFTRGIQHPRNHIFPKNAHPTFTASIIDMSPLPSVDERGIKTITYEDTRWLHCDIKSLNLLVNVMASTEANEVGAAEAIFHRDDVVTECSHSNVFIVKDSHLLTHPANNFILNGITRQVIIKLAHDRHISVQQTPFSLSDLYNADEVFISSIGAEVTPVIKINDSLVSNESANEITTLLANDFTHYIETQLNITL